MMKLVLVGIIFCATATHIATGIQIDNQLISSKNGEYLPLLTIVLSFISVLLHVFIRQSMVLHIRSFILMFFYLN